MGQVGLGRHGWVLVVRGGLIVVRVDGEGDSQREEGEQGDEEERELHVDEWWLWEMSCLLRVELKKIRM